MIKLYLVTEHDNEALEDLKVFASEEEVIEYIRKGNDEAEKLIEKFLHTGSLYGQNDEIPTYTGVRTIVIKQRGE